MRLIDADAVMEFARSLDSLSESQLIDVLYVIANEVPTIDAVRVVHGKWIYEGARGRFPACRCSVCENVENADWAMISGEVNYCPQCGARMDEK